jgi:hypothetical protein
MADVNAALQAFVEVGDFARLYAVVERHVSSERPSRSFGPASSMGRGEI